MNLLDEEESDARRILVHLNAEAFHIQQCLLDEIIRKILIFYIFLFFSLSLLFLVSSIGGYGHYHGDTASREACGIYTHPLLLLFSEHYL